MKKTLAKIASAALITATVLGVSAVPADACHDCDITVLPNGFTMESHKGVYWEEDLEELDKRVVDLTDPVEMYRVIMSSPANPQNGPAPKNQEEKARYDRELKAFREHLTETMRDMGVELSVQEFEKLYSEKSAEEMPHAWLRFYRDEARTEEVMLNDIAVGDTVYYKLETDKGYVCTNIDINCHLVVKNHSVYADIPGDEIEYKLSVALIGDVNGDGSVDAKDVTVYMNELVTPKPYGYDHRINSDLNCDGERDAKDVLMLMKYILDPGVDICHHSEYNVNTHLRTYVISVQSEGSDWVDNTQLPEPFPEIDESWLNPVDPLVSPFWVQCYGYTMLNYKYVTVNLSYYIVNPSGGEFWDNYSCLEIKIPLPKGETNPELVVTDVSSIEDDFGPLLRLSYTIPDGAETVDTAIRIAFSGMREPFPDYHND